MNCARGASPRSGGGIRDADAGCGLIHCCYLPQAQATTAEISGNPRDLSGRCGAWKTGKIKIWVKSACPLGLFYFQYLSLHKPISCRAAPGRHIVGFGISFLDTGAGEQSQEVQDIPASQLGRAGRPWFTFRTSRDVVEAAKLEGPAVSS